MARAKKKDEPKLPDPWEHYFAMQLTPEQKAEARAEAQKEIDRARREGVYERFLGMVGRVHLDLDLDELREDRD